MSNFKTCQSKFYLFRGGDTMRINLLLGWNLLGGSVLSLVSLQHFLLLQSLSLLTAFPRLLHLQTTSLGLEIEIVINLSGETNSALRVGQPCWAWYSLTVFQEMEMYHHINNKCSDGLTWSCSCLVLAFSAFFLWMNSIKTLLFLNTFPLALRYNSW